MLQTELTDVSVGQSVGYDNALFKNCYVVLFPQKFPKICSHPLTLVRETMTQGQEPKLWKIKVLSVLIEHVTDWVLSFIITYHLRGSRGEMYVDSDRLSLASFQDYCTHPDVTLGNGSECALVVQYWADCSGWLVHCYGIIHNSIARAPKNTYPSTNAIWTTFSQVYPNPICITNCPVHQNLHQSRSACECLYTLRFINWFKGACILLHTCRSI